MKRLKLIIMLITLFTTLGNSWATGQLQAFKVDANEKTELLIFITPKVTEGGPPAHFACQDIEFTPIVAEFVEPSHDDAVKNGSINVYKKKTTSISPGEFSTYSFESKSYDSWMAVEVLAFPNDALGNCGPKAFMSVQGATIPIKFLPKAKFDLLKEE